jgi:hypothetical protein
MTTNMDYQSRLFGTYATLSDLPTASEFRKGTIAYLNDGTLCGTDGVVWNVLGGTQLLTTASQQLPATRAGFARVNAGTGRFRLMLMGDSTRAGVGAGSSGTSNSVGARAKSSAAALAARFNAMGIPASDKSFFGDQGMGTLPTAYGSYDSRVVLNTGWSAPAGGATSTLAGQMFLCTSGGAGNLSFTVPGQCDNAIVYYARNGSNGSFTWNINGGASLGTVTTNGGPAIASVTAAFTRGANVINIVPDNNGNFYIIGILAWDSTVPAIDIIQAGWAGALITSFNIATSPWHPVGAYNLISPHCTAIQLSINDANAGTPVPSFTASEQAIVTRAAALGSDVIIESGIPSNHANSTNGTLAGIITASRSIAAANNSPFLDIGARYGGYAKANAMGFMYDSLHPNALGYQDVALAEARMLASV